jgi:hypothetical protein
MRKLDRRGVAAFEFCVIAVPLFTFMFIIFDLGRYAITMQSLRALANADARAMMIQCYTPAVVANTSPSSCTGSYLSTAQMQNAAPFLYAGGLTPTLGITASPPPGGTSSPLIVTASQPGFTMLMPIWGTALPNAARPGASASTQVPF